MPTSFADLLTAHMRRIRASAAGVACEIGMSREAVNNWRLGTSRPNRKHRARLLACTSYLRLTEAETNQFLRAAGFEPEFPAGAGDADTNAPFEAVIEHLFARLQKLLPYPILMLLSQAHWGQPPCRTALLARARRRFGESSVLHLQPPYSLGGGKSEYFSALGMQCGFEGIDSDFAFERALDRRLRAGEQVFCMVSRFEQGEPAPREVLAGILRSLSEMHAGRLHLLLCGGAALAELKYQSGDLSLLNIASVETWPEMTLADLRVMGEALGLREWDDDELARVLALAGGHPVLTEQTLQWLAQEPGLPSDTLQQRLVAHPRVFEGFLPLLHDAVARARMGEWLQQARVAPMRPYLLDPLLRGAYWANLLAVHEDIDGRWLQWRCEAVRVAGLNLVAQMQSP